MFSRKRHLMSRENV